MKRLTLIVLAILLLSIPAGAEYVPPNVWEFDDDYYNIYAEPDLSASLMGDPTYERGESPTLMIQVMNEGKILGFETDKRPTNANETKLAAIEQKAEARATTAIGITATLTAPENTPIEVESGPQRMGSLPTGRISQPAQYQIEIDDNAPAGTYNLTLKLEYEYQADVAVTGNPNTPEMDYWYKDANTTQTIQINIKKQPYFQVTQTNGYLATGQEKVVNVTIKNTGEKTAYDAVARISVLDPLSTTDDQAYLGTLQPGDEATAQYKISVEDDATPKTHSLNVEIKYRDNKDESHISSVLKAPVEIKQGESLQDKMSTYIMGTGGLIVVAGAVMYLRKKK